MTRLLDALELCAGAGGQALGLEGAGFEPVALVEIEGPACGTLQANRPAWNVLETDLRLLPGRQFRGIDLLAAGIPCPPFSVAGKQLGSGDDRDLFPEVLRITRAARPRAVLVENVPGLLQARFRNYRARVISELQSLGYVCEWTKLNAADFGVPQLRPRSILVALKPGYSAWFRWPRPDRGRPPTVGETLLAEMAQDGWKGANDWAKRANDIAPTLVGGSKKHGGPDLGPTRAKRAWAELGVDGLGVADAPPPRGFEGMPRLTVKMCALLQGFPPDWRFMGTKTQAYRQVGNAFPPPVARAVGEAIAAALEKRPYRRQSEVDEPLLEQVKLSLAG